MGKDVSCLPMPVKLQKSLGQEVKNNLSNCHYGRDLGTVGQNVNTRVGILPGLTFLLYWRKCHGIF